jgi:hypothetical protein
MKKLSQLRLFYTTIITFILSAIVTLMYWGGPYSINGSVARLHLDGLPVSLMGGKPGLVFSGHRFKCDLKLSPEIRSRCTTVLAGKPLELKFRIQPFSVDFCKLKYGDRVMKCDGLQDYRNQAGQADFWIKDSLDLTAFDRIWILLNNPLANIFGNINELDWDSLIKILPWLISFLLCVGIWLDLRKLSVSTAILFGLGFLFLVPFFERLVTRIVLIMGHVD